MNQTLTLETRACLHCGRKNIKCLETSEQMFCNGSCERWERDKFSFLETQRRMEQWQEALNQSRKGSSGKKTITVGSTNKTESSEKKSLPNSESTAPSILRNLRPRVERPIAKIKSEPIEDESNGPEKIENNNEQHKGNGMQQTNSNNEQKSISADLNENPLVVSSMQSQISNMVGSNTANLLDDTISHLHGLMKGLTANDPSKEVRLVDPDKANTAANCAKQMYMLMRLKLDIVKVAGGK